MAELGSKEEFEMQIKALKLKYIDTLPERKRVIGKLWQRLRQGRFDCAVAQELNRRAHNLVGSGGLHGYSGITDAARDIETLLSDVLVSKQIAPHVAVRFDQLLQRLGEVFDESISEKSFER